MDVKKYVMNGLQQVALLEDDVSRLHLALHSIIYDRHL